MHCARLWDALGSTFLFSAFSLHPSLSLARKLLHSPHLSLSCFFFKRVKFIFHFQVLVKKIKKYLFLFFSQCLGIAFPSSRAFIRSFHLSFLRSFPSFIHSSPGFHTFSFVLPFLLHISPSLPLLSPFSSSFRCFLPSGKNIARLPAPAYTVL